MSHFNRRSTTPVKFGKTKSSSKSEKPSEKKEKEKSPAKKSSSPNPFSGEDMAMSRKSSVRIKPLKQNWFEFIDTVMFDITKVAEIKKVISKPIRGSSLPGALTKSWAQSMVEQIILFYKIVVFHQDAVRVVLELINTVATAPDTRIDEIVRQVKGKEEIDGIVIDGKKNPVDKMPAKVIDGDSKNDTDRKKWNEEVRAEVNVQDTEKQEQQARRVRGFKAS